MLNMSLPLLAHLACKTNKHATGGVERLTLAGNIAALRRSSDSALRALITHISKRTSKNGIGNSWSPTKVNDSVVVTRSVGWVEMLVSFRTVSRLLD